jgi:DNA-binding IclR family transcriptional regulator
MRNDGGTDEMYQVKTVLKAFQILETVQELERAGVSDIASKLDMSKSSVYKHLNTLESVGYVLKEDGHIGLASGS